jgi:hypothetical protein
MLKNTRPPEWFTELSSNRRNRNVKSKILLSCSARPVLKLSNQPDGSIAPGCLLRIHKSS